MQVRAFRTTVATTNATTVYGNGKKFQTAIYVTEYKNGAWIDSQEFVNCGATQFRRRNPTLRYQIVYTDGSAEFVTRAHFNELRKKYNLSFLGK